MNDKYHNPLTCFLDMLNIKHTIAFSEKLFNEHPNNNNLLGLSQMLDEYNIVNGGIRVDDKDTFDLMSVESPFIAQMGTGFAIVSSVSNNKIVCILNNLNIVIDIDEFKRSWTGVLLIAKPDENSIEPNYKTNKKESFLKSSKYNLSIGLIITIFILGVIHDNQYKNMHIIALAFVNLIGIYVSYLLVLKQLHIHNTNADKICSIFKEGDCNDILDTDAAKLFGTISWSEIGLGYFTSNLIVIAFVPDLTSYLFYINILTLPYSFWSLWYQRYRAKQWCPLCVLVQIILWVIFVINIFFNDVTLLNFTFKQAIIIGLIFIFPTLAINVLLPLVEDSKRGRLYKYTFNSMKFTDAVFSAMLAQQPHYEINTGDSKIIFGNPAAKIRITVFSNPHCNPCARMHKKAHKLLSECEDISVQYIFCSFGPEWEGSTKHLLAIYLNNSPKEAAIAYDEWFESGKDNIGDFLEKYRADIHSDAVLNEYSKHVEWGKLTNMSSTPTVFVNGYLLPNQYTIDDMKFFDGMESTVFNS